MSGNYWKEGSWNVICQRCGRKYKAEEVEKEWTGLIVCKKKCFETRHPQDFVRAHPDDQKVAFNAPRPEDQFVTMNYISTSVGVQENTVPTGTFTTNNNTL